MREFSEQVPDSLAGERLDRLLSFIGNLSRNEAAKMIRSNLVSVNGRTVDRPSFKISLNDRVHFLLEEREENLEIKPDPSIDFKVIHSDPDFLVVNKPAGLVVHPGAGNFSGTLVNGLLASNPSISEVGEKNRPGIIHRLDKNTSGLLLVANTKEAYEFFTEEMSKRNIKRFYKALVFGVPDGPVGVIDAPIGRSTKNRKKMAIVSNGKHAITTYKFEDEWKVPNVSLLEVEIETGRTHQIRVHLSSIGNPVVGDDVYGGNRNDFGLKRQFLHAFKLSFLHPRTGEECEFEIPLPDELQSVLLSFGEN